MTRRTSSLLFVLFIVGLVGCDHATKHLAETELRGHAPRPLVTNVLELRYTQNRDVGFSLLRKVPERVRTPLIYVGSIAGLAFLGLLWSRRRGARWPEHLAYAVILSGAVGNLTDRLMRGYVVDFVYLHHWPVFNVADAYLVVGGALLLLGSRSPTSPPAASAPPPASA